MNIKIINIKYDTDGQRISLPKELNVEVPDNEEDVEEFLSDYISDTTGFCHFGFDTIPQL